MQRIKLSYITNTLKYTIPLLLIMAGFLQAQETQSFSLEEAKAYAKKNNYDVQKALLAIEAANKQKWEVTASGFPQVAINAKYQKLIDIPVQLIPGEFFDEEAGTSVPVKFGKPHNASYGISATQLIFNGSYIVGLQASKTYLQLSEQAYKKSQLDAGETVTQTYFLVLLAEENRKVLSTSLENIRKTHYEISEMYKEGFTEETDVKQLQISITELENQLRSVEQQIELAYRMLKLQMGIDIESPIILTDDLNMLLAAGDVNLRLQKHFEVENNIDFKLLLTQERLANLSYKNEMSTFLPTISAFASIERTAQRDKFDIFEAGKLWFPTTVAGIQFSWPIFSGGQKIFRVQKAKVELKQAEIDRKKAEQGLRLQYTRTHSAYETAYETFKNSEKNKILANDVYRINLEKFKEGMISSLDLVQAHNQFLRAEGDYLQSASDLLTARTQLDKLLNEI